MISSAGNYIEKPTSFMVQGANESHLWTRLLDIMKWDSDRKFNGLVSSIYWFQACVSLFNRGLMPFIIKMISYYPNNIRSAAFVEFFSKFNRKHMKDYSQWYSERVPTAALSRLSLKIEPGKVRVFAIVDTVTQWVLRPLHRSLFTLLRTFSTDATFDQNQGLKNFFDKTKDKQAIFSYDLSAATDRLPLTLQVFILNTMFGNDIGNT